MYEPYFEQMRGAARKGNINVFYLTRRKGCSVVEENGVFTLLNHPVQYRDPVWEETRIRLWNVNLQKFSYIAKEDIIDWRLA